MMARDPKEYLKARLEKVAAKGISDRSDLGDYKKLRPGEFDDLVIQEHKAERAGKHYDVRIGNKDTGLLSWATKKEMPKPGDRKALFQQPLHDYEYRKFEGLIPKGYGKGEVKKYDEGKVLINRIDEQGISFTRADKKFPERFKLIKPKEGEKRWLLINTTPTKPIKYDKMRYVSVTPQKAEQIIKNLKPGASVQAKIDGAASLTKLLKDKFETLSYRTSKQTGGPIVHTERLSGGQPAETTGKVPQKYVGSVLRGELYGVRNKKSIPPQELGGLLNSSLFKSVKDQKERGIDLKNLVFDVEQVGGKRVDINKMPYADRLEIAKKLLKFLPAEKFHLPSEAKSPKAALKLLKQIESGKNPLSQEGIVIHPPTGKPIKSKLTEDYDVYIREITPGQGKYKDVGVGGFRYSHSPRGRIVGRVGSGLSDELRQEMFKDPASFIGRVAKVTAQEKLKSNALRAPRLLALHEDK